MSDYQRMENQKVSNELKTGINHSDDEDTQANQTSAPVAAKAVAKVETASQSVIPQAINFTASVKSNYKNPFNEKEKELDLAFRKFEELKDPQVWLRDQPDFNLFCTAYNNSIIFYDTLNRKIIQQSVLDKDVTFDGENFWTEKDKIALEVNFDDILEEAKKQKEEQDGEEEENEDNEEEENHENEEKEDDQADEEKQDEQADEGQEDEQEDAEGGDEENQDQKNEGSEEVTCLASFPELYLVALGSNHGNIYLLNSYDFKYVNSYKTGQDKVLDLVAGKSNIFSLHEDGSLIKLNFSTKVYNDQEKIKQAEEEEIWALKISPNKRWLAFCQFRIKKKVKEEDNDEDYYQLVVQDLGEDKKKKGDDEDSEYDNEYGSDSEDSSEYSGGEEEKKKIKELRYDMKLTKEDYEPQKYGLKGYEEVVDLEYYIKLKNLFEFTPDSRNIVVRTDLKVITSYLLGDKVAKVADIEKMCEEKSRVLKIQILSDSQTLICMSGSLDQAEDIKIIDLEATSKKIRLGCSDAKEFVTSQDGKMIFAIDYDQKDGKSQLKCFDIKTKTLLVSIAYTSQAILLDISPDSNFIYTYNRQSCYTAFIKLADYQMNVEDKAVMDDKSNFIMQFNKKTGECELWNLKTEQIIGIYGKSEPYTVCGEYFYIVEDLSGSKVNISRVSTKTKEKEILQKELQEEHYDLQVTKDNQKIYCLTDTQIVVFDIKSGESNSKTLWSSNYPENYRCFQLSNNEKFIMAVSDNLLYKIEIKGSDFIIGNPVTVYWWPKRLDAFHPTDSYMLSRYHSDTTIDKWDLSFNQTRDDYIQGHKKDRVEYNCFVSNGEKLVTMNAKELIYWDVKNGKHAQLEQIDKTITPIYGHNKKLTGLKIDGKLHPWSEFLIYELSGNFAQLGKYKERIEKKSAAMPFYKVLLKSLNYIQGPYNKLFPYIFQQFVHYKDDEDPNKIAMIQHMLAHVISPEGFTFLGYLAYNNKQAFMKEALKYHNKYLRDINGNFPLTLALKKKSVTTVNMLVEFVSKDQKFIEQLNHDEICMLLEFSPTNLPKLISNSISKIRGADPLGIDVNEDLTDFYTTDNIVPAELHDKLCDTTALEEDKKPVVYKRIAYLLNLIPGSKESVRFHEALAQCQDPEVYQSDAIKYILEYKWQLLKKRTYWPLFVSIVFLLALLLHVYTPGQILPLYLLLIFLGFSCVMEFYKFISGGLAYVSPINFMLILLLPIYVFQTMNRPGGYADYILPVVNFLVWINLTIQLKSFTNIRGFMIVLTESVISIKTFFAFFVLQILMFTSSLIIQGKIRNRWNYFEKQQDRNSTITYSEEQYKKITGENINFSQFMDEIWQNFYGVYLKMLGEFGLDDVFGISGASYNYFDQVVFIVLTFILCVTLLNLVVALMSSAYEEYKGYEVFRKQKELNSVILSVEIQMSAQRNVKKYEYLVWMEYQEDNLEKKSEIGQINEKMDENQSNWKKLLEQTKSQDERIDKLANSLGVVQKEQASMNSKLDELIKLIKDEKTQPPADEV